MSEKVMACVAAVITALTIGFYIGVTTSVVKNPTTLETLNDKALYIPGSVCILKATSDTPPKDMLYFADACVNTHREWLITQGKN